MKLLHIQILSGALFILFSLFGLWFLRREYRVRGKLSLLGSVIHVFIFAVHGFFSGMLAWGPGEIPPMSRGGGFAVVLMVMGLGLTICAMDLFHTFSRWLGAQTPGLKTSGLYRFSRNPQFVGYGIFLAGYFLAWRTPPNVIGFAAYALLAHTLAKTEEEHLSRIYGQDYLNYLKQVPRFFGRPAPKP